MADDLPTTPLAVVERIYQALAEKDLEVITKLFSPDIVVVQDPALPWGGRYEGIEAMGEFVMKIGGAIESQVTILALYDAGNRVVQYGRTAGTVRATGARFDIPECHIWRVEDGKAVEANYFIDSTAMLAALAADA
jgi:ketosteroid isomerase-like protein